MAIAANGPLEGCRMELSIGIKRPLCPGNAVLRLTSPSLCSASRLLRHSSCAAVCLPLACFISYQDTWTFLVEGFQLFILRGFQRKSPGELLTTRKTRLDLARAPMSGSVALARPSQALCASQGAGGGGWGARGLGVQGSREQPSPGVRAFPTLLTPVCLVTSEGLS